MNGLKEFLNDLIIMFAEKGTEYPSKWQDIPRKYKKPFLLWVERVKQQRWEKGNQYRAWEIYQREYLAYLINNKIKELDDCGINKSAKE